MAEKANVEKVEKTFTGLSMTGETILVYIFSILGFIFSFMDESKYSKRAKFLYNQAGSIFVCNLVLGAMVFVPYIRYFANIADLLLFIFTIIAIVKGCQGEDYKIPGVYDLGQIIWGKKKEEK